MAAQVKTNRLVVRNTHSRRPRLCLCLGKMWHADIIRLLCRRQKITEAVAQNRAWYRTPAIHEEPKFHFKIIFQDKNSVRSVFCSGELQLQNKKGKGGCYNRRPLKMVLEDVAIKKHEKYECFFLLQKTNSSIDGVRESSYVGTCAAEKPLQCTRSETTHRHTFFSDRFSRRLYGRAGRSTGRCARYALQIRSGGRDRAGCGVSSGRRHYQRFDSAKRATPGFCGCAVSDGCAGRRRDWNDVCP